MFTKLVTISIIIYTSLYVSTTNAQLSSPIAGAAPTAATPGKGAGVHSPLSPIAPLPVRADVLSWSMLADVKTKNNKGSIVPVFNSTQMALHLKKQRVHGFMMPLDPGEKQSHFLLSSVPLSCGFCTAGGPESMVEVRSKTPVKYTAEPGVVEGSFQVLVNDQFGVYYRIADAQPVK
jgi:uncharacterized protein